MNLLQRLMSRFRPTAEDRIVIDQTLHYETMEATIRRLQALDRLVEKEQAMIAGVVGAWAREDSVQAGRETNLSSCLRVRHFVGLCECSLGRLTQPWGFESRPIAATR